MPNIRKLILNSYIPKISEYIRNRQLWQRIDAHEKIVVWNVTKRSAPLLRQGVQDDIDRIETPGEAAGMVRGGQGLQKQRNKRPAVVQRKRDHNHNILSLGTGATGSCQYNSGIANSRFCGTAETETGVTKRFGMFRNIAYR